MDLQDYMGLLVLSLFSPSLPSSFLISFLSKLALLHICFCLSLFFSPLSLSVLYFILIPSLCTFFPLISPLFAFRISCILSSSCSLYSPSIFKPGQKQIIYEGL